RSIVGAAASAAGAAGEVRLHATDGFGPVVGLVYQSGLVHSGAEKQVNGQAVLGLAHLGNQPVVIQPPELGLVLAAALNPFLWLLIVRVVERWPDGLQSL